MPSRLRTEDIAPLIRRPSTPQNHFWTARSESYFNLISVPNANSVRGFNFGEFNEEEQAIPSALKPEMPFVKEFSRLADGLCQRILRLLSKGLKIRDGPEVKGEEFFTERHDRTKGKSGSILRLLHVREISYFPSSQKLT